MLFLGVAILVALLIVAYVRLDDANAGGKELTEEEREQLDAFEAALRKDSVERQRRFERKYPRYANYSEAEEFEFDPNKADSVTFLRLGLRPWQASNALKYRRKGGRWKSAEHFSKLYGLSTADFERLRPYIRIAPTEKEIARMERRHRYDSIRATYVPKFEEGTTLDINTADTAQLKRIPGIGSYYARKICNYREALGGFVSVAQINEIPDLPKGIERWFVLGSTHPASRTINVNKADFKTLVRHPYLNYEQVKEIVNYIRTHGPLTSWHDLNLSKNFSKKDFERLRPYFRFK